MTPQPATPTPFPYTTLFRSYNGGATPVSNNAGTLRKSVSGNRTTFQEVPLNSTGTVQVNSGRSEEHTSELQSQFLLVWSLLVERINGIHNRAAGASIGGAGL